ncbi:MAG: 30S ribosomal protein S17 [Clostridia bacterium]|nr:30S ribosomal protein S17 [Clostridia bacterium]
MEERNNRRKRVGKVISNKMDKTVVVAVTTTYQDPEYKKYLKRTKTYKVHDENNECNVGDVVEIAETRPLSKDKYHRLNRIIERAK